MAALVLFPFPVAFTFLIREWTYHLPARDDQIMEKTAYREWIKEWLNTWRTMVITWTVAF
jgi:hypothetical protein